MGQGPAFDDEFVESFVQMSIFQAVTGFVVGEAVPLIEQFEEQRCSTCGAGTCAKEPDIDDLVSGENELYVQVGTPGLGEGAFASIDYFSMPRAARPLVELEFPHRERRPSRASATRI